MSDQSKATGLILTGGGARAAYQVGVLLELAAMRQAAGQDPKNPFDIICGTSAGAINASVLACGADQAQKTLSDLHDVWSSFRAQQVYRSEVLDMIASGARLIMLFSLGWALGNQRLRPQSLLDNAPLRDLLHAKIDFSRLPSLLAGGHLQALAVTASNYSSGEHVTFYQSRSVIEPWIRHQRQAVPSALSHNHLLASSSIPFLFPARRLHGSWGKGWFGDGSMRQMAPISPAIHLGAEKILVIGSGRMQEPTGSTVQGGEQYPTIANVAGHALSSIFLDALAADVERLQRINHTLSLIPPDKRRQSHLKPIELLVISPSQRLDVIASKHATALPGTVQKLLKILGVSVQDQQSQGGALISYLLFESVFTQELIALGRQDARSKSEEIHRFFGW